MLATAYIEGEVTNARMQDLMADHPSDITKLLRGLVVQGLLDTDNQRRWTRYRLPTSIAPRQDLFSGLNSEEEVSGRRSDSFPLPGNSSPLPADSSPLSTEGEESPPIGEEWKAAAVKVAGKGKVSREEMEAAVLELCRGRHLTLTELAQLLNRAPASLRNKTLTPMIKGGRLRYRYPDNPNRPDQAYTTVDDVPAEAT